jgi:hypothetical protein
MPYSGAKKRRHTMNFLTAFWNRIIAAYADPEAGKGKPGPEPMPDGDIQESEAHRPDKHGWEAHGGKRH